MLKKIRGNRFFLPAIIAIFTIIFLVLCLKIFLCIRYNESELRTIVTDQCKNNLNKALKFDDISITVFGNIVINGVKMSFTDDFNDNLNSMTSNKISIVLDLFGLLSGEIKIKGIRFYKPVISVTKQYGKSYEETFRKLFTINSTGNIITTPFTIDISDGDLNYSEIFSDSRLNGKIEDMDLAVTLEPEIIRYDIEGDIYPCKTPDMEKGSFHLKGSVALQDGKTWISRNRVRCKNFDISYVNDYLQSNQVADLSLNGAIDLALNLNITESSYGVSGDIDTSDLHIVRIKNDQAPIVSDACFIIGLDMEFSPSQENLSVKKLTIRDDELDIDVKGEYSSGETPRFKIVLEPARINLAKVSEYITPFNNYRFGGELSIQADMDYRAVPDALNRMKGHISLKDLSVDRYKDTQKTEIIRSGKLEMALENTSINLSCILKSRHSDLTMQSTTSVASWYPFKSSTELTAGSGIVKASVLGAILSEGLDLFFSEALDDSQLGYEERYFLTRPAGRFIQLNDIFFTYKADSILFQDRASIDAFRLGIELKGGQLKLNDFNMVGYDASYSLNLAGELNMDYPHLAIGLKINGFDVTRFSRDLGKADIGGKADLDIQYDLRFYRPSHMFENAQTQISMRIQNGFMKETGVQKRLSAYLARNGYNGIDLGTIQFSSIWLNCAQIRDTFYVRPLSIVSPTMNLNGSGRYTYISGLELNLYMQAYGEGRRGFSIPMTLEGELLNPHLWLKNRSESGGLSLLDGN